RDLRVAGERDVDVAGGVVAGEVDRVDLGDGGGGRGRGPVGRLVGGGEQVVARARLRRRARGERDRRRLLRGELGQRQLLGGALIGELGPPGLLAVGGVARLAGGELQPIGLGLLRRHRLPAIG